jgi:hypothetical protein
VALFSGIHFTLFRHSDETKVAKTVVPEKLLKKSFTAKIAVAPVPELQLACETPAERLISNLNIISLIQCINFCDLRARNCFTSEQNVTRADRMLTRCHLFVY